MRTGWLILLSLALAAPAGADPVDALLHYPFDASTPAGTTAEAMGTGLDLSLLDTTLSTSPSLGASLGGSWVSGSTLECDGSDSYAFHADEPTFEPSEFTISTWVHIADFGSCGGGHCSLVSKANSSNSPNGYWVTTTSNGTIRLTIANNSVETELYGNTLTAGEWEHVVATWNGTEAALYHDGLPVAAVMPSHGLAYSIGYIKALYAALAALP